MLKLMFIYFIFILNFLNFKKCIYTLKFDHIYSLHLLPPPFPFPQPVPLLVSCVFALFLFCFSLSLVLCIVLKAKTYSSTHRHNKRMYHHKYFWSIYHHMSHTTELYLEISNITLWNSVFFKSLANDKCWLFSPLSSSWT